MSTHGAARGPGSGRVGPAPEGVDDGVITRGPPENVGHAPGGGIASLATDTAPPRRVP